MHGYFTATSPSFFFHVRVGQEKGKKNEHVLSSRCKEPVPGRSAVTVVFWRAVDAVGYCLAGLRCAGREGTPPSIHHFRPAPPPSSISFLFHLFARERYSMPRTAKSKRKTSVGQPMLSIYPPRLSHLIFNAK